MLRKDLVFNPFILGTGTGLLAGNLSLGIITTGLTLLIWGPGRGKNFIIINTILLVVLTGNVNFEILFIYSLILAYLIEQSKILRLFDVNLAYNLAGVISLVLFPLWKSLLGMIPAQLLNEINISGEIILLSGLILTVIRGMQLIKKKNTDGKDMLIFLLLLVMAGVGIHGNTFALPIWALGTIVLVYLERRGDKLILSTYFLYSLLFLSSILMGYLLLPVNFIIIAGLIIIVFYLYLRKEKVPLLEMVYLSLLLGLLAGRLGLLA